MVIAIDGPAGSGKSTIARMLARELGFTYVNSGNIYRAMTLRSLLCGLSFSDRDGVLECSKKAKIEYRVQRLFLDGKDAEDDLHSARVDASVAQISAIPEIRLLVNSIIKEIAAGRDSVVEGRDITTVVFPDAEVKIFLDATPEARALRRLDQGTSGTSIAEIRANIEMRDSIDRNKSIGTLKISPDAFYLDASHLTIQQVYDKVYGKILLLREPNGR